MTAHFQFFSRRKSPLPNDIPTPVSGFILSFTSYGGITISAAGTAYNIIPPGAHTMMPTDISYILSKKPKKLCKNFALSVGPTNITQFASSGRAGTGYRDTHINDAYSGTWVWAWNDNSQLSPTSNTLDLWVRVGNLINGKLILGSPTQLTNYNTDSSSSNGSTPFDTSVAINRKNINNIVVSYCYMGPDSSNRTCRAISFDNGQSWPGQFAFTDYTGYILNGILYVTSAPFHGTVQVGQLIYIYTNVPSNPSPPYPLEITGIQSGTGGIGQYILNNPSYSLGNTMNRYTFYATFPYNGLTNIQPGYYSPSSSYLGFDDNPGVKADQYGNIWYGTTNLYYASAAPMTEINQPTFWISSDEGVTFAVAYTTPVPPVFGNPTDAILDDPQFCFGINDQGQYGMWFSAEYFIIYSYPNKLTSNTYPVMGFIPITGLGQYGTGTTEILYNYPDIQNNTSITASLDGRVWKSIHGYSNTYVTPGRVVYKSPGPLNSNYSGPWQFSIENYSNYEYSSSFSYFSYPDYGYFNSAQTIIYDDNRLALYVITSQPDPDWSGDVNSQNMRFYLVISRDNGQTWSKPLDIANSTFGNRGFPTMALDTVTGDLVFGWYDGRNDPINQQVEYFAAVLRAKTLDKLVAEIPLSNPILDTGLGPAVPALTLLCASSSAQVGSSYTSYVSAYGGVPPYSYAIIAGSLPPGLNLTSTYTPPLFAGEITGIPTTTDTYNYTAEVTDSTGATATAQCSITVAAATSSVEPAEEVATVSTKVDTKPKHGRRRERFNHAKILEQITENAE